MIFQKLKLILSSYYVKKNSNAFYDPDGKLCLDFKNFNKIITSVFKKISLQRNFNYQKKILIIRKKFITWKLFYIYNILSFFFVSMKKTLKFVKKKRGYISGLQDSNFSQY
ncbi:hypothetical protein CPARA_2gp186 (nucleomorph) [Cryptomonas paramecium]|uniref:Uncharacterized protein n=1 Tax=Cryptomonas paramaecium TaxID=2898 RepID=F2HHP8_9CRYP|nr:hypothetical protein CPARA_2gp186 [Cryptomonas paramecium]AEA38844.1 hypothetical protein CPARA_2gp186 [Cryptomonas paramecium]